MNLVQVQKDVIVDRVMVLIYGKVAFQEVYQHDQWWRFGSGYFPETGISILNQSSFVSGPCETTLGPARINIAVSTDYSEERVGRPDRFPVEVYIECLAHMEAPTGLELAIVIGGQGFHKIEGFKFLHFGTYKPGSLKESLATYIYVGPILARHDPK